MAFEYEELVARLDAVRELAFPFLWMVGENAPALEVRWINL